MDLELAGQTAVIAGAAKGIGRAIAAAFAAEGANVALLDVDAGVTAVAEELAERYRVRAVPLTADLTDFAAVRRSADEIQTVLGRTDHIVCAAAIGSGKYGFPFWNLEPADWKRVLEVNILGSVNLAHAFAPALVQARAGTMLFLSSVAGQIGSQTDPPYSASKAALLNFTQCAAKDLAAYGVRVNALCPGMVETALNRSVWESWNRRQPEGSRQSYEEWAGEKVRRLVPLGRWQKPEDIAAMAVFLASPRAGNVTGQTINVDGGYVMR
ncbi:MAG TPA: SDR family oxidoreductase [Gemmataceae bacterium]|jgi:NAD(P)-dependent dehydrogenase (short-subunit alcohol dehydrogenase family)